MAGEIDDELEFHIEQVTAELRGAGRSEADARAEALRRFGDLEFTRRYCRVEDARREQEKRRMTILDEASQDRRMPSTAGGWATLEGRSRGRDGGD